MESENKQSETKNESLRTELDALAIEINDLEWQLKINGTNRRCLKEVGDDSILHVMILNSGYPIGLHIFMKLLCFFFLTEPDFIVPNLPILLYASDALALYFSGSMTLVILALAMVSKRAHTNYAKKKSRLEKEAVELERELAKKKIEYINLEYEMKQVGDARAETLEDAYAKRARLLETLNNFREQVLTHYREGTLDKYLESLGFTLSETEVQKEKIGKTFEFKKKNL